MVMGDWLCWCCACLLLELGELAELLAGEVELGTVELAALMIDDWLLLLLEVLDEIDEPDADIDAIGGAELAGDVMVAVCGSSVSCDN